MLWFQKYLRRKELAILSRNTANLKLYHNIFFKEKCQFFEEKWRKSPKVVIITIGTGFASIMP
jgi:hypothetical protein